MSRVCNGLTYRKDNLGEETMEISKASDTLYEVNSDSSSRIYFVKFGQEGPYWSCTCQGWSMTRNKAGGIGHQGKCKHVTEINRISDLADKQSQKTMAESLMSLRADLEAI